MHREERRTLPAKSHGEHRPRIGKHSREAPTPQDEASPPMDAFSTRLSPAEPSRMALVYSSPSPTESSTMTPVDQPSPIQPSTPPSPAPASGPNSPPSTRSTPTLTGDTYPTLLSSHDKPDSTRLDTTIAACKKYLPPATAAMEETAHRLDASLLQWENDMAELDAQRALRELDGALREWTGTRPSGRTWPRRLESVKDNVFPTDAEETERWVAERKRRYPRSASAAWTEDGRNKRRRVARQGKRWQREVVSDEEGYDGGEESEGSRRTGDSSEAASDEDVDAGPCRWKLIVDEDGEPCVVLVGEPRMWFDGA